MQKWAPERTCQEATGTTSWHGLWFALVLLQPGLRGQDSAQAGEDVSYRKQGQQASKSPSVRDPVQAHSPPQERTLIP